MEQNPYESNLVDVSTDGLIRPSPASRSRRIVNFLVDYTIILAFWFLVVLVTETVWLELRHYDFRTEQPPDFPPEYNKHITTAIATIAAVVFGFMYFFATELAFKRTIGKCVTGTCVTSTDGTLSARQLLKRTACRLVPWDCFTFLSTGQNGLHDRISGTFTAMK